MKILLKVRLVENIHHTLRQNHRIAIVGKDPQGSRSLFYQSIQK